MIATQSSMPSIAPIQGAALIRAISSLGIKPRKVDSCIEVPIQSAISGLLATSPASHQAKITISQRDYAFLLKWTGDPHLNGLRWGPSLLDFANGIVTATAPNCTDTRMVGVYFAPRKLNACGVQERVVIFQNLDYPPPVSLFNCRDHIEVVSLPGTPRPQNVLSFPKA